MVDKIIEKIDGWISREPDSIGCVVIGKHELEELKTEVNKR